MSRRVLQPGKEGTWDVFFLPEIAFRSLNTARGSQWWQKFVRSVVCGLPGGLPGLVLCFGNNGGRSPRSFYISEAVCFEASLALFPYSSFCFLGPPGFGESIKEAKGNRGLGSFKKKKREGAGSLMNFDYVVIKGR